ncbi:MAG: class I SAM-dependent methyltransferase [Candidatus Aenigmarchaeota archaeon]|nr:class I SAM-dependent methyltransferase [Candidatus Aenigmarchaeota archaeon]
MMKKLYRPFRITTKKITKENMKKRNNDVESFYNSVSKNYYENHIRRFCDEILEYFIFHFIPKPHKRLLDLGGGAGRFAIPLAKDGYNVTLLDISSGMLRSAERVALKHNVKLNCVKGSVTDLRYFESKSFDIIVSVNSVLDYCDNYRKALTEIFKILKSGGTFVGTVNNLFVYATANELKEGNIKLFEESMKTGNRRISWGGIKRGHITHEFTYKELFSILRQTGFTKIRILGPFNLLGKYFQSKEFLSKIDKQAFFELQLKYARKSEYINNSTDFFFICKRP